MMNDKIQKLPQVGPITVILAVCFCFVVSAKADVWRDDFNDESLKGWTPTSEFFIWEVQDGGLHVKYVAPKGGNPLEALELTAFPGPHQQFTITATNMKTIRSAGFGIALGKRFPPPPEAPPVAPWSSFWYVFFTHSIYARIFEGGGSGPFNRWVPSHPGTIWDTRELKEMKLSFNAGRFQMFANGELRADFVDDHFDQIERIGFVMWVSEEAIAPEGWADSFTISGPSLAVEPRGKLATTWGKLKLKR